MAVVGTTRQVLLLPCLGHGAGMDSFVRTLGWRARTSISDDFVFLVCDNHNRALYYHSSVGWERREVVAHSAHRSHLAHLLENPCTDHSLSCHAISSTTFITLSNNRIVPAPHCYLSIKCLSLMNYMLTNLNKFYGNSILQDGFK